MSEIPTIAIFAQSAAQAAYISDIVRLAGYTPSIKGGAGDAPMASIVADKIMPRDVPAPVFWLGATELTTDSGVRVLRTPLRASVLIDHLRRIDHARSAMPAQITIGAYTLDTRNYLWEGNGRAPLRLTEKETAILAYLKAAQGDAVSREELLEQVWSYADGVETHTLETHIYRLRQKIETDPSKPDLLITAEDGYILKG